MAKEVLQDIVDTIHFDDLNPRWRDFDLAGFSRDKELWRFQQQALRNALKALWYYYNDIEDFDPAEDPSANDLRKRRLFSVYNDYGIPDDLHIELKNNSVTNRQLINLLDEYYVSERDKLQVYEKRSFSYRQFINRMSFWMATGSGKTLILVKLVEILKHLVALGEIPSHDMLLLTHRDDLITQFKKHVQQFNEAHGEFSIRLESLKHYDRTKRSQPTFLNELIVFYYPCTALGEESGPKMINFRDYENEGRWYVLLDEAHKGDSQESKRQHIYSILSRNGFLFNFSASFTDDPDIVTTVFRYNLADFIRAGYGKHIAVLQQEIRGFRKDQEYIGAEKQKTVLKSLLLLAYLHHLRRELDFMGSDLFHRPLLVTLGHTVNTDDADARLFFRELVRIGRGDVQPDVWYQAKEELWDELRQNPRLMFEDANHVSIDEARFHSLTLSDLRQLVFNTQDKGDIEFWLVESNDQEMAFKLKTADDFFGLVRIGDIGEWVKWLEEELEGYEHGKTLRDESFFAALSQDDSTINVLLGSRTFYEGWDSNRPNVMNFINIGMSRQAKKFILQSVGRGVRIEPIRDSRKRVLPLVTAGYLEQDAVKPLREACGGLNSLPIETLFLFATNRDALENVISHLTREDRQQDTRALSIQKNEWVEERRLLVPIYEEADHILASNEDPSPFETTLKELQLLQEYVSGVSDDRVLLARHRADPEQITWLRRSLLDASKYYDTDGTAVRDLDLLVQRALHYFSVTPQRIRSLQLLEDEITHFRHIEVSLKDLDAVADLEHKVEAIANYGSRLRELADRLENREKHREEVLLKLRKLQWEDHFGHNHQRIRIQYIEEHYYLPVLLSDEEGRVDYIRHIIDEPSEIEFVNDLNDYARRSGNLLGSFDWWAFSKLDETLDEIYIPYYNPEANEISHFFPDFIFWMEKDHEYAIVFVDPKSTKYTDYLHKVKGFKELFEYRGDSKAIKSGHLNVRVFAFLYTQDRSQVAEAGYGAHWYGDIEPMLRTVIDSWSR